MAARCGSEENIRRARAEALAAVSGFDESVLRPGREFYARVYQPRRDRLVARWFEEFLGTPPPPPARGRRPAGGTG